MIAVPFVFATTVFLMLVTSTTLALNASTNRMSLGVINSSARPFYSLRGVS